MKRILAISLALVMAICFGACNKVKSDGEYKPSTEPKEAFYNITLVENGDSTNTITFKDDGKTFEEIYQNGSHQGTWVYDEENDTMTLTYDGMEYSYVFYVSRDAENMITGMGQGDYESARNFTIKTDATPDETESVEVQEGNQELHTHDETDTPHTHAE